MLFSCPSLFYDLHVFSKVLKDAIPENTVLSHDLLEGSYLRCALVSDILLMDGYPTSYMSFRIRLYRWIRGDYQILPWLRNKIENKNGEVKRNLLLLLHLLISLFHLLTFSNIKYLVI